MIRSSFTIPVYNCKVIVIFDEDITAASKRIFKKHKMEHSGDINYAEVIYPQDTIHLYYILFSLPSLTLNLLVHEITHLGGKILMDRNHSTVDGDEPQAYLNGHIAEEIEKIMIRKNIPFIKKSKTKTNCNG